MAIIATNVGAVNLLVNNESGYLMELSELQNLHTIINQFIELPSYQIDEMKKNAVEKIRKDFLWSHIAALHVNFFNTAIAGNKVK